MTIETWKTEFYPTPASECPADEAIEHSLRKWRGMLPSALQRHGLVADCGDLVYLDSNSEGMGVFHLSASSCALCAHFYSQGEDEDDPSCVDCPLARARNGTACDCCTATESRSPWGKWTSHNNPEPMIAALETALAQKTEGST